MPDMKIAGIRLLSRQDGEEVLQEMPGEVMAMGQALYVKYKEPANEQGQETRTTLKITTDTVKMIRHGAVESEQSFQQERKHPGFYRAAYTSFNLSTHTHTLVMDMQGMYGQIRWTYDLYVYDECVGHFDISVDIQEETQS
ncbi:YwiB family protein [Paenibacillus pini]|uniref:DUF1934 domain-containing protein n=1 Tax=Paenibacillus pini JCM 16418 TaxID=1236976 RepID=W7YPN4_9BACL|nr:DUF1934 domain-containing protein [Paenibacillus pini]GAF10457.1 hypothetical protein JCM16418_4664 [Paenibacillus pini JCM 16418]